MKPAFSLVIIARNEEKTLPILLNSLRPFFDAGGEMVVVDTGSKDRTAAIAHSKKCKIDYAGDRFRIKVTDSEVLAAERVCPMVKVLEKGDSYFSFPDARNHAASLASNDFVLMPDADEFYTALNIPALHGIVSSGQHAKLTYKFLYGRDQHGQPFTQFVQGKFYDRRKLQWKGIIHEELFPYDTLSYRIPDDQLAVEHKQNATTDRTGYMKALMVRHINEPNDARTCHYLARELYYRGHLEACIMMFEKHINMPDGFRAERSQSELLTGDAWWKLGNEKEAVSAWFRGYAIDPKRRDGLMRLANFYIEKDRFDLVITFCEMAKTIPDNTFYANVRAYYSYYPDELLYRAYYWAGDKVKAKECWVAALTANPSNPKYAHDAQFFI